MIGKKIALIQRALRREDRHALLVGNFGHEVADDVLYYLLLKKLELGFVLIEQSGRPILYAIPFEAPALRRAYPELRVLPYDRAAEKLIAARVRGRRRLAIRPSALPAHVYTKLTETTSLRLKEWRGDEELMTVKLTPEIARIRAACRMTDGLFRSLIRAWHSFMTETDAARFLLERMAAAGAEPSFPPIIASGSHAASPHHVSQPTRLSRGFCVIDMGVRLAGYCSDMTRTIYLGTPSKKERELYERVKKAQAETVKKIRAGIPARELDVFCRSRLGEALSREFIHGLGHGVGTQVHESPRVTGKSEDVLVAGMVITIEPGVYREGAYGIRIEDDILVKNRGSEILTKTPRRLHVIS